MPKNIDGDEVELPPKSEEEILLERLVFGDISGFESNLKKVENLYDYSSDENIEQDEDEDEDEIQDDEDLFFIDEQADPNNAHVEDSDEENVIQEDDAWEDSDDENVKVSLVNTATLKKLRKLETDTNISGRSYVTRLRSQFEKIYPRPEWIEKLEDEERFSGEDDSDIEMEDVEENVQVKDNDTNSVLRILQSTQKFIITTQLKLVPPQKLAITRLKDANYQKLSKSAIQSLSFHHSHPLLLTGGFDKTMRIYHIDGKINNLVTSLFVHNTPISTCGFSSLESESKNLIFVAGRRRYMNKWDLNSGDVEKISRLYGHEQYQKSFEYFKISAKGNFIGLTGSGGWCNILNGSTGQWIKGFKVEGLIADFEFSKDETFIIIINKSGQIWEYDLTSSSTRIIKKWQDDGGIGITRIALGGKDRWIAVGSNNGVVNIYDRNSESTRPFKTVENLVSSISTLKFNADGQILCIASKAKRDALRLVHMPSGTVFSNWPTSGTPLGRVTSVDFSPNNEMFAVGNEGGKITLWRLNHY